MTKHRRIAESLLVAIVLLLAVSAAVLAYSYRAPYTVTNNSTTAYAMLPVSSTVNSTYLANNGFMLPSALDTRVETLGGLAKPHTVANDKVLSAIQVPATSQTNLYFTTGNAVLAAMDIITGYGGNVTVADNTTTEPGWSFSSNTSGYVDTTAGDNRNILFKSAAARVSTNATVSGNVYGMITGATGLTQTLTPNGAGDLTNVTTLFGAATHWESQLTNDGATSYVGETAAVLQDDTYAMTDGTIPSTAIIDSVTIHLVVNGNGAGLVYPAVRLGGVTVTLGSYSPGAGWTDVSVSLARPGGGSWTYADIPNVQAGMRIAGSGAAMTSSTQTYAVIAYHYLDTVVNLYGVSSGDKAVSFSANGTTLYLAIGASTNSTAQLGPVPDNANAWWLDQNNVMPYMDYFKHAVSGTLVVWYEPNTYIIGTTLPNRASGSDYGVIAWGAMPTGVNAALGGIVSAYQPSAGSETTTPTRDIIPSATGSDWYRDPDVSGALLTNPLRPLITLVSDNTTLAERQVWVYFGIVITLIVLMVTATNVRGHHLITGVATAVAVLGMVVWTVFPLWALVFVAVSIVAGVIAERAQSV